ncbi:hypothetical protein K402DRAFT_197217 [Aulographum hederae CBS 113979]|uniref:Uncharacterized protein n=1 Tax=Aulographum hederae CBS 113979 TaxID=1176131 RepID=A0A6G1GNE0_9PEZI|nr:hypothetical protein K402DRAFT_197217 [Aulographum hederae CBS 113979]
MPEIFIKVLMMTSSTNLQNYSHLHQLYLLLFISTYCESVFAGPFWHAYPSRGPTEAITSGRTTTWPSRRRLAKRTLQAGKNHVIEATCTWSQYLAIRSQTFQKQRPRREKFQKLNTLRMLEKPLTTCFQFSKDVGRTFLCIEVDMADRHTRIT